MPTYEITAPDGRVFEVTAPDGASQAQVLEYAKRNFNAPQEAKPEPMSDAKKRLFAANGPVPAPSLQTPSMGFGTALAVGAGRKVDKLIAGVQQLKNWVAQDDEANSALERDQQFKDAAIAPRKRSNPIGMNVGESLPGAIASVPFTGGASIPGVLGTAFMTGAVPELLSYGTGAERVGNGLKAGVGSMAGAGVGVGLAKMLQPVSKANSISDDALQAADRLGLNLSAGERTQNPTLQIVENWLSKTPGYSGKMQARQAANQAAINRAASGAIGQSADNVGESTLSAAKAAINSEYTRLNQLANPDAASPKFMGALQNVDSANISRGPYKVPAINAEVEKGLDLAAAGKVPGSVYQEIRSTLGDRAQAAFKSGDDTLGRALKEIQKGLDDAAKDSLSSADQAALDLVRKQYSAYKVLTKGKVAEGGNVSPARLATALQQTNPDAFRRGAINSPLMDIARVGEAVKSLGNPNSGNLAMAQMIFGNPLTGIPTVTGNRLLGSAYMSAPVQSYLSSGLLTPAAEKALLRATVPGGLLGYSAARE